MHPTEIPTVAVESLPPDVATADDVVLLDVREDDEWAAGHIAGAVHVPMGRLPQQLQFDPGLIAADTPVVVVCKVGGRSAQVTAWLRHNGFEAANLEGGMLAWAAAKRPMRSTDGTPARVA